MLIGDRIRTIREAKKLSQGDIEARSGLLRTYISRVENGHTVPSVETLQRLAGALDVPLWKLFHEGKRPARFIHLPSGQIERRKESPESHKFLVELSRPWKRMKERDRTLLLHMAQKMAAKRNRP